MLFRAGEQRVARVSATTRRHGAGLGRYRDGEILFELALQIQPFVDLFDGDIRIKVGDLLCVVAIIAQGGECSRFPGACRRCAATRLACRE